MEHYTELFKHGLTSELSTSPYVSPEFTLLAIAEFIFFYPDEYNQYSEQFNHYLSEYVETHLDPNKHPILQHFVITNDDRISSKNIENIIHDIRMSYDIQDDLYHSLTDESLAISVAAGAMLFVGMRKLSWLERYFLNIRPVVHKVPNWVLELEEKNHRWKFARIVRGSLAELEITRLKNFHIDSRDLCYLLAKAALTIAYAAREYLNAEFTAWKGSDIPVELRNSVNQLLEAYAKPIVKIVDIERTRTFYTN